MAHFLTQLLFIRLKQAWRSFYSIGWLLVLALPLGFILLLIAWEKLSQLSPWGMGAVVGVAVLAIHTNRQDLAFLKKSIAPTYLILGIEYQIFVGALFTLPIILLGNAWSQIWPGHLLSLGIPLIPAFKKISSGSPFPFQWIPIALFEWKSGLRRYWLILLPIYLAGIILAKFTAAPLVSMLVFLILIVGFYNELEHRMLIEEELQKPNFLLRKWLKHGSLFALLFIPQIVLFLIYHTTYWYLIIVLLVISELFLACAIFYKYSTFLPNRQYVNNQTAMSILFAGIVIPFLMPILIVALVLYYRRAQVRLQYFFPYAKH